MGRAKRNTALTGSDSRIRKAVAALHPPTHAMLLDRDTLAASRQIQRILSRGKSAVREVRGVLADLASKDKGLPVLKNPGFSFNVIREIPPISQALSGLYLPSGTPDVLAPPARRYTLPRVWTSTFFDWGMLIQRRENFRRYRAQI
jgi:hypothetical protein